MKRLFSIVLIILIIFPLSACSLFSGPKPYNPPQKSIEKLNNSALQKNKAIWAEKIKHARIETTTYGDSTEYQVIPTNVSELKKYNPTLIKGTVYNLQEMTGDKDDAYTKVSVFVNKVLRGNKSIQNTIINFNLNSGFIYKPSQKEFNYMKKAEVPMPQIGSKIITGIRPREVHKKDPNNIDKFFIKNKSADKNAFNIINPSYNLWVKDPGDKDYRLDNPFLTKKLKDDWYAKKLLELTDQLNRVEN